MKRWREEKIVINYGEGELYNGECWNLERWCLVGGDKGWKGSTRGEWKGFHLYVFSLGKSRLKPFCTHSIILLYL